MSEAPPFAAPAFAGPSLDQILTSAFHAGASDIHISSGAPIKQRVDGDLEAMPEYPDVVSPAWAAQIVKSIMKASIWDKFEELREHDMSYNVPGVARFRVNAFHQRNTVGAVFRVIPSDIKSLDDLGMPPILKELVKKPRGLILVTGPTGSGKSTTLAAMIDAINSTKPDHIMTIEDPIEFVHTNKRSLVNQREVGSDTLSFAESLKRVLRQDPDVILVGELRDPETISIALTAAETGHLVFGTLHTQSASKTLNRIIDSFSSEQQGQVKAQLSATLEAVISQTLLKRVGGGRVAATEIMVRTNAIANMISEGKVAQIYSAIQTGSTFGMHTLDQELQRLVSAGLVSRDEAAPFLTDGDSLNGLSARNADWNDY